MKKEQLIGRKAFGFKFAGAPSFITKMEKYIGVEGTITDCHDGCRITFNDNCYWYPYPEILNHLVEVEPELTLDETLEQIKNLKP